MTLVGHEERVSMVSRAEITTKYATAYARASKDKGRVLDRALWHFTVLGEAAVRFLSHHG